MARRGWVTFVRPAMVTLTRRGWYTMSGVSTIDLRVDYLRFADGKDLMFEGKLVRMGNRIMVTKMKAFQDDVLVAEGKGVYNFIRA